MPYVIDAYNAIFADKGLSRVAEERLERARDALVALWRELARAGRTVVAVFWNHYDKPGALPEAQNAAMKLHLTLGLLMAGSALAAIGA